ncbi:MAG: cell envelope integrity protein CreD [Flammeovirgaceae bacterium]
METISNSNLFERFNNWIKDSVMIKLLSIGFLLLILMIPNSWIQSLITERQQRAESVVNEISEKWSGDQTVSGPVLVIPFLKREKIDKGKDGIEIKEWREAAFFLPERLTAHAKVKPEKLHRGIFDAAVYESEINMQATFSRPDFGKWNVNDKDILWKDAKLVMGINDLRGINKNPVFIVGGSDKIAEPSNQIGLSTEYTNPPVENDYEVVTYPAHRESSSKVENGVVVPLQWNLSEDFRGDVALTLGLKGSTLLYFVPVGKTTHVRIEGPWANPSFTGNFSPTHRKVTDTDFNATWNVLHYNRPFSQQWVGEGEKLLGSEFGVKLLIPVGQYQKSMRTAKYGVLVILLTFVSLFLVEIIRKVRIHPFQYILVGAALIIYYSLLLSFSEHVGYDAAYWVATIATVVLVSLYAMTFLLNRLLIGVFGSLLTFFYLFIFVIIQMQDYSLLLGSVGLFVIIALIMYFSKSIKWYGEK